MISDIQCRLKTRGGEGRAESSWRLPDPAVGGLATPFHAAAATDASKMLNTHGHRGLSSHPVGGEYSPPLKQIYSPLG